ncbi:MAG: ATP synthase F1 subunit delta [Firmicutes bacterium]|nr:ATP synthase F1 subunit delta [Bacillota bacterium]
MKRRAEIYGSSLYDLAQEEGLGEQIMKDLQLISAVFSDDTGYEQLLSSPVLSRDERRSLIEEAWKGKVHDYTKNFLCILMEEEMVRDLSSCVQAYRKRYKEDRGIIDVRVTSAVPLSEENRARLKASIEAKTGKKVLPEFHVDSSLLGGLRVEMEGMSYEATLKYHLEELRKILSEG